MSSLVLLEEALADLVALGREEGEDHAAADEQLSALASRLSMTPSLSETFEPPSTTTYGPLRGLGEPLQHVDLGGDQAAHRVREALRDVVHRRLLAVHHAEAVGDERVGERGELVGERRHARAVVLAGLAGVEPDVLQHRDLAVGEPGDRGLRGLADGVGREGDVLPEQLAEAGGDRAQGVAVLGRALRTAEVRRHDHPRPGLGQGADGRDAGADPAVVGDGRAVERDVEVGADQDALALDTLLDQRRRACRSQPCLRGDLPT